MGRLSLPRQLASAAVVVALVLSMAGCRDKVGDNERGDGGGNEAAPAEQAHDAVTPGAALCIAVECAAVMPEPGLSDR